MSARFQAKVAKVLARFSQVLSPLLVACLPDSRLRLPRFSQGSPKALLSGSPSLGGSSAGVTAKVAEVLPKFTRGSPKWFFLSWWLFCRSDSYGCQGSPKVLPRFSQGSPKVLLSGSPSLGGSSAGVSAKVAKVLPRFSQGSPKWFFLSWWLVCRSHSCACQGSPKLLLGDSPSLGGSSAGITAKVAEVPHKFSKGSPK